MRKLFLILIAVMAWSLGLSAQTKTISGTVVDAANNEPLIGATIMPVGGGQGAAADFDGHFTLTVPQNVTKATVSYVGYTTKTVDLQNGMTVYLASSSTNLDDVVVVAYGTANKASISGSVSVVGAAEIEDRPVTSATAALEGNAPGVQVNNTYGSPGTEPSIRIRGFTSAAGDSYNAPIYVVDGVPFSGTINDLNPADIESMSVLKDAASAALYGNKGANGVILITTKRAKKEGKIDVTLSISQGMYNRGIPLYDRLDANQWMEQSFQGALNQLVAAGTYKDNIPGATAYLQQNFLRYSGARNNIYGVSDDELFTAEGKLIPTAPLAGYTDLDWWKAVSRSGYRQEYNVNAAAATEKFNIFASVGYLKENGYVLKTDFERFTGRINAQFQPTSYFRMGVNLFAAAQKSQINQQAGASNAADPFNTVTMAPIYPYYAHDANGDIVYADGQPVWNTASYLGNTNIAYSLREDFTNDNKYMIDGTLFGTVILPYGFDLTVRGNIVRQSESYNDYMNNKIGSGVASNGNLTTGTGDYHSHTFMQTLNWSHEYGLHHVDVMLDHENWNDDATVNNILFNDQMFENIYYISNFTTYMGKAATYAQDRTESYLGRARYNFAQKYFLDASFRRDGSSRFAKGGRWGNFASVGAVWVITKEKFMHNLPWVNFAKLRASYGSVGNNAAVGTYSSYAQYFTGDYFGNGMIIKGGFPGDNVRWEATKTFDIALEGSLFNDILSFSIGYFDKRSTDLLFAVVKPGSAGSPQSSMLNPSVTTNIGTMSNRGWELSFGVDILRTKDFYWNFSIDATFLKNKIMKLPNHDDINKGTQRLTEGRSLYEWCTYHYAGVDQLTGNALYELSKDSPEFWKRNSEGEMVFDEGTFNSRLSQAQASADGVIERDGKYYVTRTEWASKNWAGTALPTVYGSFGTNLTWRGIKLGMLFTYSLGGKTWDSNYEGLMTASQATGALHKDILLSWNGAPEGMTADSPDRIDPNGVPQFNYARYLYNNGTSDRWLTSSSYLVFKNLNISYDLPQKWVAPLQMQNINIGMSVDNLFTVTARKGLNPQYTFSGSQANTFVTARVFSFQVTAKF